MPPSSLWSPCSVIIIDAPFFPPLPIGLVYSLVSYPNRTRSTPPCTVNISVFPWSPLPLPPFVVFLVFSRCSRLLWSNRSISLGWDSLCPFSTCLTDVKRTCLPPPKISSASFPPPWTRSLKMPFFFYFSKPQGTWLEFFRSKGAFDEFWVYISLKRLFLSISKVSKLQVVVNTFPSFSISPLYFFPLRYPPHLRRFCRRLRVLFR